MFTNWWDTVERLYTDACQVICSWDKNWFHNQRGKLFCMELKDKQQIVDYVEKGSGDKNHLKSPTLLK